MAISVLLRWPIWDELDISFAMRRTCDIVHSQWPMSEKTKRQCVRQTYTGGTSFWELKGDTGQGGCIKKGTGRESQRHRRTSANGHQGRHCLLGDANVNKPHRSATPQSEMVFQGNFSSFVSSNFLQGRKTEAQAPSFYTTTTSAIKSILKPS